MNSSTLDITDSAVTEPSRRVCIAPMMDWTDRHDRYFLRLISREVLLYTEMVTTGALIHGDRQRFLQFNPAEQPLALQLGGSSPLDLAQCAAFAQEWQYNEVNLNVGCPSDRVQAARIGACLMAEPDLVAVAVSAMRAACDLPVTVKTRIGIDDLDSYEFLTSFIKTVADAGCATFIVHARKAWLTGLSPKQNREIPPLRHDVVYQLKQDFPDLEIILNGGVTDIHSIPEHLDRVDGVMLGRAAYQNPYLLAEMDQQLFGIDRPIPSRADIIAGMLPYIQQHLTQGVPLKSMTRHMLGLFQSQPGARSWRRILSEQAPRTGAGLEVLQAATASVLDEETTTKLFQHSIAA